MSTRLLVLVVLLDASRRSTRPHALVLDRQGRRRGPSTRLYRSRFSFGFGNWPTSSVSIRAAMAWSLLGSSSPPSSDVELLLASH